MSDLLGTVLVDRVVVGHGHGVGEAEVDLMLARPRLALRGLNPNPGGLHPVSDLPDERLVVGRREDVVVEDVGNGRREVAEVLRVRLRVALLQKEEFELRAEHRPVAERLGTLDLTSSAPDAGRGRRASRRARRRHRGRMPSPPARGCGAACPGRERGGSRRSPVPSSRSRSRAPGPSPSRARASSCSPRAVVEPVVEEELGVESLSQQTSLHVGEGDDDGVDRAALDVGPKLVYRKHSEDSTPASRV